MRRWLLEKLKEWFVPPSGGVHLDCADGIRGVAILMVVAAHGFYTNPDGPKIYLSAGQVIGSGWLGVPIFFVLSAFLLSLPFFRAREKDPQFWYVRGFALRRILKILPPFYLVSIALALFFFWNAGDTTVFARALAWATGVGHFVHNWEPLNGSFWSLWVEIGFYAVLPFLFLITRGRRAETAGWIAFVLLTFVPLLSRFIMWRDSPMWQERYFIDRRFPNSLDHFGWGILFCVLYLRFSREPDRWRWLARLGYLGVGVLALSAVVNMHHNKLHSMPQRLDMDVDHSLQGIGACLLLFFALDPACLGTRLLSSTVLRFFGAISYEWFLLHQPVQWQFRLWMGGSHGSMLRYLCVTGVPILLTLGASILIYQGFSLPIMRWGRKKLAARAAQVPRPAIQGNPVGSV